MSPAAAAHCSRPARSRDTGTNCANGCGAGVGAAAVTAQPVAEARAARHRSGGVLSTVWGRGRCVTGTMLDVLVLMRDWQLRGIAESGTE